MTSISYLYSSQELINYFKETIENIQTIVVQMEGEGHKDITTSNRWGIDLANANRIEQIQAQIASYCSKKKGPTGKR
ncbi:uncharacterized protein PGTG_11571 [Puccinia graminis f. sp. tritici CRL 75-36-700-3]|uniref:Uncharacterized protein n=1 Tax=Puccinia graminis f. sp. tritici (strain CRL 75-36-700-3 / race SCCL) TaxID=418459 RepID=E3KNE0_PUCGT|nr:uncharacterized protein PGTG_11571 [Puccinia graminis f. sp. tritici CRL 75-36-700-3]EFP85815.2 hypothetical protein PGTG_11571 [Puccinia graminis f. sp. tritici CRL 75-36-700-3]